MIITFTLITFVLFVLHVESTNLRIWFESLKGEISRTFGRADFVYPNTKQPQSWMRTNIIKSYK